MSSVEKCPTRRVDQQPNTERERRNNSSEDSPPITRTPESHRRLLIWILRILIVLFVLNRNLNRSLGQMSSTRPKIVQKFKSPKVIKKPDPIIIEEEGKGFDHFVLNMNWPATICAKGLTGLLEIKSVNPINLLGNFSEKYQKDHPRFTIHGLWPSNPIGSAWKPAVDCLKGVGYDEAVENIQNIDKYWPSFVKDKEDFWHAEWKKHGTCATYHPAIGTCKLYFQKAIELAEKLDQQVQEGLKVELFSKSKSKYGLNITYDNFVNFIQTHYGYRVKINYQLFRVNFYGKPEDRAWVESIHFCYDLKFKPMDCYASPYTETLDIFLPKINALTKHCLVDLIPLE